MEHSYLSLHIFNNSDYDFYSNEEIANILASKGS